HPRRPVCEGSGDPHQYIHLHGRTGVNEPVEAWAGGEQPGVVGGNMQVLPAHSVPEQDVGAVGVAPAGHPDHAVEADIVGGLSPSDRVVVGAWRAGSEVGSIDAETAQPDAAK